MISFPLTIKNHTSIPTEQLNVSLETKIQYTQKSVKREISVRQPLQIRQVARSPHGDTDEPSARCYVCNHAHIGHIGRVCLWSDTACVDASETQTDKICHIESICNSFQDYQRRWNVFLHDICIPTST